MKISGIDKDFVDIINYLDKMGFKPFSSCDGVLANHKDTKSVTSAYIAFLKSPQIIDLMAAFLRDKDTFEITISNASHREPHYYFDNLIIGNRYNVLFSNKSGNLTQYFERIIKNLCEGKIKIQDDEKRELNNLSETLENDENSDLEISVSFNSRYQPYMNKEGRINVLRVGTKDGCGYYRNMHSLIDMLHEKYGFKKKNDSIEETFEEDEFSVSFFDGSVAEIYFTDEHTEEIQGLIRIIRELGHTLPTFEVKEFDYELDYDDIDYTEDEPGNK